MHAIIDVPARMNKILVYSHSLENMFDGTESMLLTLLSLSSSAGGYK